jgi:hypothetical protein|tara:strand:- start:2090 stop:2203 length:114 start_codon:yes stop_codon:yes gene_type:complete
MGVKSSDLSNLASLSASRLSVLIFSPGFLGINEGATT